MKKLLFVGLVIIAVGGSVWLSLGPAVDTGSVYLNCRTDSTLPIDAGQMLGATQQLVQRGMSVAVYAVQRGGAPVLEACLERDSLIADNVLKSGAMVIFISLDEPYYDVRYGDGWAAAFDSRMEGIASETVAPLVDQGDYGAAILDFLSAIEEVVVNEDLSVEPDAPPPWKPPDIVAMVKDNLFERAAYAVYVGVILILARLWMMYRSRDTGQ